MKEIVRRYGKRHTGQHCPPIREEHAMTVTFDPLRYGCDALRPEVTLDATVPNWRFSVWGDAAVRAELSRWYADAGKFGELKRTSLPPGELVEFTLGWEQEGVARAAHQAHLVEVTDGRSTRGRVWCGGRWSATLLAEMAEAADATT